MEGTRFDATDAEIDEDTDDASGSDRVSPLRAIRRHCLNCSNGNAHSVSLCPSTRCAMWAFRFGSKPTPDLLATLDGVVGHPAELPMPAIDVATGSRLKAIRRRCVDCSGSVPAVRSCCATACDLHQFRMGRGNRVMSNEQRAALTERLKAMRANRAG